jgi:hypothetical protein
MRPLTTNCIHNAIELETSGKWQKSDRVKTEVVPFVKLIKSKARRGSPSVERGTTLYAIKYELGGYFVYSYMTRERAEEVRLASIDNQTDTFQFYGFNVVDDTEWTMPVGEK